MPSAIPSAAVPPPVAPLPGIGGARHQGAGPAAAAPVPPSMRASACAGPSDSTVYSLPLAIPVSYVTASGSLRPGGVPAPMLLGAAAVAPSALPLPLGGGGPMPLCMVAFPCTWVRALPAFPSPIALPPPPAAAVAAAAAAASTASAAFFLAAFRFFRNPPLGAAFLIPSLPTSRACSRLLAGITPIPASSSTSSIVCLLFGSGSPPPSDSLPPPPPAPPGRGVPDASVSSALAAAAAWEPISMSAPGFACASVLSCSTLSS